MDLFIIAAILGGVWFVVIYWLASSYFLYYQQGDLRDFLFLPVDLLWESAEHLPGIIQYTVHTALFVLAPMIVAFFWLGACAIMIIFGFCACIAVLCKFISKGFRPATS